MAVEYATTIGPTLHGLQRVTIRYGNFGPDGEFVEEDRDQRIARLLETYESARAELQAALDEYDVP